jgi:drug/metabolite transporter (DMT)-like permease
VQAPADPPGWEAGASVLVLGIAGTGVGILLFMKLLGDFGAFRAGLVTYLMPITALLYGALLLDETITAFMVVGLVLILAGVALGSGLLRPSPSPEAVEPARP